jgi:hypothetical protein
MDFSRWYPTTTTLADGEVLVLSGSEDTNYTNATIPEVTTNAGTGPWRELTTASLKLTLYPRAFLAPNGKVFVATGGSPPGVNQVTRYLDTSGTGSWSTVGSSLFGNRFNSTAVMYDNGQILIAGGTPNLGVAPATNTAETINLDNASPAWQYTSPMTYPRQYLNSTLLPDGKVLVTGGTGASSDVLDSQAVLAAEMWDPTTGQWTTMASMNHARLYHSTAALLPDGRVLSGGTTATGVPGNDADFYSPPYLFKGARPTITGAPASVGYGQTFVVQTPDASSITHVNWLSLPAVTHAFNENQRMNRLSFTIASGSLNVTAPSSANLCPPGFYMLFALDSQGVPSVAKMVQIGTSPATVAGVNASTTGAASLVTNGWLPRSGDMIGVFVELASTTVAVQSLTDRLGNTFSRASFLTGTHGRTELWYAMGIKGGVSNAITVNLTGATKAAVRGEEFSGVPTNATLLQASGAAGAGTKAVTGSVVTSGPALLLGDIGWNSGAAASMNIGGFSRIGQLSASDLSATVCYLYRMVSAAGTYSTGVTLSTSSSWQGISAAFSL